MATVPILRLFATTNDLTPNLQEVEVVDILAEYGPAYGGLSVIGAVAAFGITPAPIQINPFTAAMPSLGSTCSIATGNCTVNEPGQYLIHLSASFTDNVAPNTYIFNIGHNGVAIGYRGEDYVSVTGVPASCSCSGIRTMLAGDTIQVMCSSLAGVGVTVHDMTLAFQKIGS